MVVKTTRITIETESLLVVRRGKTIVTWCPACCAEAEAMTLDGYVVEPVTPWETASGGKAIGCPRQACSAAFRWKGTPGWYRIAVQYFDERDGVARYRLFVGEQLIDEWLADDDLPSDAPNGHTSTRRTVTGIALRPGDEIRIEGATDAKDRADIDYLEITQE